MGGRSKAAPVGGLRRVIIEGVEPEIDGGQFPIKRTIGEEVVLEAAAQRAENRNAQELLEWATLLQDDTPATERALHILDERADILDCVYADREHATLYGKELCVTVDRERARFSTWYEMFPRSA